MLAVPLGIRTLCQFVRWWVLGFEREQSLLLNPKIATLLFYCCSRTLQRLDSCLDLVIVNWTNYLSSIWRSRQIVPWEEPAVAA